jgi:hypothetical protein
VFWGGCVEGADTGMMVSTGSSCAHFLRPFLSYQAASHNQNIGDLFAAGPLRQDLRDLPRRTAQKGASNVLLLWGLLGMTVFAANANITKTMETFCGWTTEDRLAGLATADRPKSGFQCCGPLRRKK